MQKLVIILPTYNESENILKLLDSIFIEQDNLEEIDLNVLVVDDNSPDGTSEIVKNYKYFDSHVYLLSGFKKQGIGDAYLRGFKYAIANLNADFLFEMDADYSHDTSEIPLLFKEIKNGSDFVIGSRYIEGSYISKDWPLLRHINSKFSNFFARYIIGMKDIHDCTSGFRVIRVKALTTIDLDQIKARSYSFQIVLLYYIWKNNFKISEVPITFINRVHGKSKIKISDTIELIKHSFELKLLGAI